MNSDELAPFRITVFDKTFNRLGWVGDPIEVKANPKHLAIGTVSVMVTSDHKLRGVLTTKGTRLYVEYLDLSDPDNPDYEFLMSGPVIPNEGSGESTSGTLTVTIEDDQRVLWTTLGWPVPGSPYNSQGTSHDKRTGNVETVVKGYMSANFTRLGRPVTVATNLNRGPTVTVQMRMQPLADYLVPLMAAANLGLQIRQVGSGLVADLYTCTEWPHTLTEENGTVVSKTWSRTGPDATRTVIGGQGEMTAREFQVVSNTSLEAEYGDVIEVFVSATDTAVTAELLQRGTDRLLEGAPKASISAELSETQNFRYGGTKGVHVGDLINIEVEPGAVLQDVLTEVVINWNNDTGLVVTPVIGDRSDDPSKALIDLVMRLARQVNFLQVNV